MSLIINALKKADKNKNSDRFNRNFFRWNKYQNNPKKGLWVAIMIGLILMIFVGTGFLAYIYFFAEDDLNGLNELAVEKTDTPVWDKPVKVEPSIVAEKKDYFELDEKNDIKLGPDIDEEIRMDELETFAVTEPEPAKPFLPVRAVVSEMENELPEFVVSGVIWTPVENFVYVNGIPYREKELVGDVVIEKIMISSIIVTYKGLEYEIILQ